eukprot:9191557-Alexandrium_andersonii.AAC.1
MSPVATLEAAKLHSALRRFWQKPSPVPSAAGGGTAGRGRGSYEPVRCAGRSMSERLAPRRGVKQTALPAHLFSEPN